MSAEIPFTTVCFLNAPTEASRTLLALGSAPRMAVVAAPVKSGLAIDKSGMEILAWLLAGLAVVGFALLLLEMRQRHHILVPMDAGV